MLAVATVPFAFVSATTSDWLLMAALLVRGLGFGAVTIPLMTGAYVGLERRGGPARQHHHPGRDAARRLLRRRGARGHPGQQRGRRHDLAGVADAFDVAFWWAIGFTVLAVGLSFLLPKRPARADV